MVMFNEFHRNIKLSNTLLTNGKYLSVPQREQLFVKHCFDTFLHGYYAELAEQIDFESSHVNLTNNGYLYQTIFQGDEVIFIIAQFPHVTGEIEVTIVEALFEQFTTFEKELCLPIIPLVVFKSEKNYQTVLTLLPQLPEAATAVFLQLSVIIED